MITLPDLDNRKYVVHGDAESLVRLSMQVMNRMTRDGWVICAADACFEHSTLVLGAISWCSHPNAVLFWHKGLETPYERISEDIQRVLDVCVRK